MGEWSYAARKARARALGFDTPYQQAKASSGALDAAREALGDVAGLKRSAAARDQAAREHAAAVDAVTQLANGEQTSSDDGRVLLAAIKRAARDDRYLSAIVTVLTTKGTYRDVGLWRPPQRYSAASFLDDVSAMGGVKPAFLAFARFAMQAGNYPETPVSVEHVDLTATD